jgi:PAS domain S-box-containing protein
VAVFAFLSLAGVGTTVVLTDIKARQALQASMVDRLALSSHEREESIRRWVEDERRQVEYLAGLPAFRRSVLSSSFAPSKGDPFPFLDPAAGAFLQYSDLVLLSVPDGKVLRSTDPGRLGKAYGTEKWFLDALAGTSVRKPYRPNGSGVPVMTFSTPVRSPSGAAAAVLAADVRLGRLDGVLREPRVLERTARVLLLDRDFLPVAGSGAGKGALPVRSEGARRAFSGETGWALYRDGRSVPVIGFFRRLPLLDAALLVEMEEEAAFAPARDLGLNLAVLGIFVAAILSLLVQVVARRVSRPLVALTEAVREVERGNLDAAVPVTTDDETGVLGSAFNRMTAHFKELYDALRASERGTREILDATSDAILLHDAATGAVLDANASATALFGHSRDELLRCRLADLCAEGEAGGEELRRRISRAVLLGAQRFEWLARRRDGKTVWIEVILAASDVGGKGRVLSSSRDISGRKDAEAELARHRERLEELVRERSVELEAAQEELLKRERLAVLGRLIATVSHELRNPLGTVRNCVWSIGEAVRRGDAGAVARPLHLAERNIRRCGAIIDELLDYSRAKEARLVPVEMDLFLSNLLDEVTLPEGVGMARAIDSRGVAAVDPVLFRRCFQNVVENALQAMEGAGGGNHLLTVECAASEDRVEVRVSDTGPGIDPDLRERVFEPLFSTKPTGVGLGLPLVRDVMEKHGGAVEVGTAPGGGAAIVLRLPRHDPPEGE